MITPMNLESALKRLQWFISKKGYTEDKEAFNTVVDYINLLREKQIKTRPIVTKFFLHEFLNLTRGIRKEDAYGAIVHIQKTVQKPLEDYYKTLMKEVPYARFGMLYQDYTAGLRQAKRIAEANKTPAAESETLSDKYQTNDLLRIREEKNKIQQNLMTKALKTPYEEKEAKHFVTTQVTELLLLN